MGGVRGTEILRKLERMQFPPAADYEMVMLPERW